MLPTGVRSGNTPKIVLQKMEGAIPELLIGVKSGNFLLESYPKLYTGPFHTWIGSGDALLESFPNYG